MNFSKWDAHTVNKFLKNGFPKGVESFTISSNTSDDQNECCSFMLYKDSVFSIANYISYSISLKNMLITSSEFDNIITIFSWLPSIELISCTILTDSVCDFSLVYCQKLKHLTLNNSGDEYHSKWKNHPERLRNILLGIANSFELSNCISLDIVNCGISNDQAEQMKSEANLHYMSLNAKTIDEMFEAIDNMYK